MTVLLIATEQQKMQLGAWTGAPSDLYWLTDPLMSPPAQRIDACVDLLFDHTPGRLDMLMKFNASMIAVNSVVDSIAGSYTNVIRFNGWNTFLERNMVEAVSANESSRKIAEECFTLFGKKIAWTPDVPGFIAARVIACIINEAYIALGEQLSTKEEIDTAMKLGTNYPFGPFEWAEKIGTHHVHSLLTRMAESDKRYMPADSLNKKHSG